jgi:methyl-accepting chemotaxis protein
VSWRIQRVQTRLLLGFGLTIAALFAAGLVGISAMGALREDVQTDIGTAARIGNQLGSISDATLRQVVLSQTQMMSGRGMAEGTTDSLAFFADSLRRVLVAEADLTTAERSRLETVGTLQGRIEVRLAGARAYLSLGNTNAAFEQAGLAANTLDTLMSLSSAISLSQIERMQSALRDVDSLVARRRTTLMILLALGFLIALGSGLITWQSVTRPIDALVRAADSLGSGRLAVQMDPRGLDREFGAVVNAFRQTAARLRDLVAEIQHEASSLGQAAQLLDATSGQAADSTGQVSAAMTEVAQDADMQRQEIAESRSSLDEAGRATTITEQAAAEARDAGEAILRTAEGTAARIGEALKALNSAQDVLRECSSRIAQLESASSSIDAFIKVVRRVANQTELLALNASIEAARAREHGRGFAVVAHEVRTLAADSAEAARETEGVVRKLRSSLRDTVGTFDDGIRRLTDVGTVSERAVDSLKHVDEAVTRVESVTAALQDAAQQGQRAMRDLRQRLQTIGVRAEQQAAASEQAAAATEQTAAASQEVSATAKSLHETAERLLALVRRFET